MQEKEKWSRYCAFTQEAIDGNEVALLKDGEEAFPAYLESRIANFYERAGLVKLRDGSLGSITIGGAVSPASFFRQRRARAARRRR